MEDNLSKFCFDLCIEDPRKIDFTKVELDSKIRNFVIECNKSDYLFTIFSCQGHYHDNGFSSTYFSFIVDNLYESQLIMGAYDVCRGCFDLGNKSSPLSGGYDVMFSKSYVGMFYSIVSIYWGKKCIDNDRFYSNLKLLLNRNFC